MNLGEALALSTAGDLVLAYLVDTGQSEDAEQLAAALKKFKAAIRQSIPQTPGAAVEGRGLPRGTRQPRYLRVKTGPTERKV